MGGFVADIMGYEDPPQQQQQQVQQQAVRDEPTGPTKAQMANKRKLSGNRRGRNAMILKSKTGSSEDVTLGNKALLS